MVKAKGPKKPLGAYMFFSKEKTPELMKKKGLSLMEASKLCGQMWRELKNKKKYENLNTQDILRYQAELDEGTVKVEKVLGKKRSAPTQQSASPKAVKK